MDRYQPVAVLTEDNELIPEMLKTSMGQYVKFSDVKKLKAKYEASEKELEIRTATANSCMAHIERIRKAQFCPVFGCDNSGCIAHQISDDEWEPQQCEWCYVTKDSLFNILSENLEPK